MKPRLSGGFFASIARVDKAFSLGYNDTNLK